MKNYLVLNGQKIELTPEQYQEVCNAVLLETKSPFDREKKVKLIGLLAMMVFCVLLESEAGVLITYTMELLIIVQIRN